MGATVTHILLPPRASIHVNGLGWCGQRGRSRSPSAPITAHGWASRWGVSHPWARLEHRAELGEPVLHRAAHQLQPRLRLHEVEATARVGADDLLEVLGEPLVTVGQITPLVVHAATRGYEVLDGFKRLRAAAKFRGDRVEQVFKVEARGRVQ